MRYSIVITVLACLATLAPAQELAKAPPTETPKIARPEIPIPLPPIVKDNSGLPHIVLMSMGGTIASAASERLNLANYGGPGMPRVDPEDWVRDLPELANIARVTTDDMRSPIGRHDGRETF